jgi:hypothetical protein
MLYRKVMSTSNGPEGDERIARSQVLAFLDEYCRSLTLQDVREWYVEAFPEAMPTGTCAQRAS